MEGKLKEESVNTLANAQLPKLKEGALLRGLRAAMFYLRTFRTVLRKSDLPSDILSS